jgi:hypothetical protein
MGLSSLGIFHTVIGIVAIAGAIVGFVKYGKINLDTLSGRIYFYMTIITSITALGLSKHGGFNIGHIFSLLIIMLIIFAYYLYARKKRNKRARYLENFLLSFSFFLSWVPTITETFIRIPLGNPIASDVKDPIIGKTLLVLFILFIIGAVFQFIKQKKSNEQVSQFYVEK